MEIFQLNRDVAPSFNHDLQKPRYNSINYILIHRNGNGADKFNGLGGVAVLAHKTHSKRDLLNG